MDFIKVHSIKENLYLFEEKIIDEATVTMMLAVGTDKAAIIDTGFGFSDSILKHIRSITDKPVICLLTHCDPDHAGGVSLFDEIYMNKQDAFLMKSSLNPMVRLNILKNLAGKDKEKIAYAKKNLLRGNRFEYRSITDGTVFDLGGIVLEAIALPGHTPGSMCYFNREDGYVFAGDSIANINSPVLFFDKCLPLATYKENLDSFTQRVGTDVTIFTGHDIQPLGSRIIPEIQTLCEEILSGNTANDAPYMPPFLESRQQSGNPVVAIIHKIVLNMVISRQMGKSIPRTHAKEGFAADIKYNANKLR